MTHKLVKHLSILGVAILVTNLGLINFIPAIQPERVRIFKQEKAERV